MPDQDREVENLTRFFMGASHAQLVTVTRALGRELVARGLIGDDDCFTLARRLARQTSCPRTEPLSYPA